MTVITYKIQTLIDLGNKHKPNLNEDAIEILINFKKKNPFKNNLETVVKNTDTWRDKNSPNTDKKDKDSYVKEVYLHLNKLSDSNIETISYQINKIINESDENKDYIANKLIERLFQSAKIQIHFCHLYASLFYFLISKEKDIYFKKIENKIKEEFNLLKNFKDENNNYDEYCDSVRLKDNYIGCYQFCIELFNSNVLTLENVNEIIKNILSDFTNYEEKFKLEIIVDALCRIIKTIRKIKKLDKEELNNILGKIRSTYENVKIKLSPRPRFLLEDCLNL